MSTPPTITLGIELLDALDEWGLAAEQAQPVAVHPSGVAIAVPSSTPTAGPRRADDGRRDQAGRRPLLPRRRARPLGASTAVTRWGGLLAFFKWAAGERLCDGNPMADIERPQRPELFTPVLSDDELRAMFATCRGDFAGVRDAALMRFLLTTGCRRAECAGIALDELDLEPQTVKVMGKGSRERLVHIEDGTALALRKYLRARQLHPRPRRPIGCGSEARPAHRDGHPADPAAPRRTSRCHPGQPARLAARLRAPLAPAGGTEGGLMSEAGWRSSQMVRRYARSAAAERGRAEHARLNIAGDL